MTPKQTIDILKETGALLEGHFLLTSGRHARRFIQAARALQYPRHTESLCSAIAERFCDQRVDLVVGPATGGIILAYETARHIPDTDNGPCRAAFTEKDEHGAMTLKRGFALSAGTRVLVVEDIVTTGGSVEKTIEHLRNRQAEVIAVSALIDRSAGRAQFDCPFEPLAVLELESWPAGRCELCRQGAPLIEPDDIVSRENS